MKNKTALVILSLLLISIVACQQQKAAKEQSAAAPGTTGEAAVDAVGKNLNNVAADEKDLSTENMTELDAGLADMQNI